MKIHYNITGANRKTLVTAICQELNEQVHYLGASSFAYEVGDYHIDKAGTVTGPDNRDLIADLQGLHGLIPVTEEYDTVPDIDQHHPGRYADPSVSPTEAMLRQADAWMDGQPAFEDLVLTEREELGLGRERREDWQGENGMQAGDVSGDYNIVSQVELTPDRLVIQMPLTGFTPEKLDNLCKMVTAKASLLKDALGAKDLPIRRTSETLDFPWFRFTEDRDTVNAYTTFVSLLCKTAMEKKHVSAKEKPIEGSPRYAMRCFLLSLGFIGDAYKAARRILLKNLTGNSAFKNSTKKKREAEEDE